MMMFCPFFEQIRETIFFMSKLLRNTNQNIFELVRDNHSFSCQNRLRDMNQTSKAYGVSP